MNTKKWFLVLGMVLFSVFGFRMAEAEVLLAEDGSAEVKSKEEIIVISKEELRELLSDRSLTYKVEKQKEREKITSLWETPQNILSVGYDMSWPFHGLSFIYWPNNHGWGLNYYASDDTGYYYSNIRHYALRYYYSIQPDLYFSAGLGKYSDDRSEYNYDLWEYEYYSYDETLLGLAFGVRVNDYSTYEFGFGNAWTNSGNSYSKVNFGINVKFDFKV